MTQKAQSLRQQTERRIDRFMWIPASAHMLLCLLVGIGTGTLLLAIGFLLVAFPLVALIERRVTSQLINGCAKAALFMGLSALLIEQTGGLIEAHFSIFIMLSVLILYSDWRIIVFGAGVIALHHALFTWLQHLGLVQLYVHLGDHGDGHGGMALFICLLQHAGAVVAHALVLSLLAGFLRRMLDDSMRVANFAVAAGDGDLTRTFTEQEQRSPTLAAVMQMHGSVTASLQRSQEIADEIASLGSTLQDAQLRLQSQGDQNSSQVERVSANAGELKGLTQLNAREASEVRKVAGTAQGLADQGAREMTGLQGAMRQLATDTGQIEKLLGEIDQITFQTNLLALNASVEAARAGQEGRGFAVVASEVRNLAGRTRETAQQIRAAIEQSLKTVGRGVTVTETTTELMQRILDTFTEVANRLVEIDQASHEQHRGIAELEGSAETMAGALKEAATGISESTAIAQRLNQMADELRTLVGSFRLPPGQSASQPASQPASQSASQSARQSNR